MLDSRVSVPRHPLAVGRFPRSDLIESFWVTGLAAS